MKRWYEYEEYLDSGLWHVHTDLTDGSQSPERIVEFTTEQQFPLVAIVEHVRAQPTYDFDALASRAKRAARDHRCECVVGCEAKVLDRAGTLDVSETVLDRADIVYAAYHGTPFSREAYVDSVFAMLENPEVDVWAHPFTYPNRAGFDVPETTVDRILDAVVANDVLFERNLSRPPRGVSVQSTLPAVPTIVGYDLHDIRSWTDIDSPMELVGQ